MKTKFAFLSALSQLGKNKHASRSRLLARLLRDEDGSYLILMTILVPVFIGIASLATEGALVFYNHRTLQSAADAAAYSAAIAYSLDSNADITTQANAVVGSYGFVLGTSADQADVPTPTVINNYAGSPYTAIQVTVSRPQTRFFSDIWIKNLQPVGASATAIISGPTGGGGGQCIISLSPTGAPKPPNQGAGITVQGTSTITAPNCGVFSNSNANNSLYFSGSSTSVTAGSIGAAGGLSESGSPTTSPTPTTKDGGITDPYAGKGFTWPSPSATCIAAPGTPPGKYKGPGTSQPPLIVTLPQNNYCSNLNISDNAQVTLNPGTFNGNISVANNSTLTLNPGNYVFNGGNISVANSSALTLNSGTYVIDGGSLSVTVSSSLSGSGVTLVFADPSGSSYPSGDAMTVSSNSKMVLSPPTSGLFDGMLLIGDTNLPTSTNFNLWANSTDSKISGVIYLPTANFNWGGAPILAGGCTQMIAYTINLQGNATFDNTGCDFNTGGGSGGGITPIGSVVTLVK